MQSYCQLKGQHNYIDIIFYKNDNEILTRYISQTDNKLYLATRKLTECLLKITT